jgi:Fic family protein
MKLPMPAPQLLDLWDQLRGVPGASLPLTPVPDGAYYHWDQLRHRTPPEGLTHLQWWGSVKLARTPMLKPISLRDKGDSPFQYCIPDPVLKLLHGIDRDAAGEIQMAEEVTNPATRDRYIISSLIEESITSSQLEGASTTSDVAKEMIRSGRSPSDRSERMIYNNYVAMRFVQEHARTPLTPEMIFTLHRIVTSGTLDDAAKAGRFREESDNVVIEDGMGDVVHTPPPAHELSARMDQLCEFANGDDEKTFIHPVIRAMILHFWIGYDHPFVDGNGRTARALFYWCMLSRGYWLAEYVSISRILRKAPGKYMRSFLYTESDGNDLTYFLIYQLDVFQRAIKELQSYLRRKMEQMREVNALLRSSVDFNHRQLAILSHALKHPGHRYTIQSHKQSHGIVYQTARADLLELADRRLLAQGKSGNAYTFAAPEDLGKRLRQLGESK